MQLLFVPGAGWFPPEAAVTHVGAPDENVAGSV
jgi:hypothetical protein